MSFYSDLPLEELSEIIARNPEEIELRLALIERYVRDGDLDDALVQACLAEKVNKDHAEVHAWKALCLIFRGDLEKGHRLLMEVTRRTPLCSFQDKLIEVIFPTFTSDSEYDPQELAHPWSLFAKTEFELEGRYGEMIQSMTEVGRMMSEEPDMAIDQLKEHTNDFPEDLNAKLYLASIHLMQHEPHLAESLYREVIESDPKCSTAYFDLAVVVEEPDESIELLRNGLELFPNQDVARYNLGTFLLNQEQYEAARKELLRIPGDSTHYADALIAIGVSLESEGNVNEAATYFEKVTILCPDRGDVIAKYGQLLLDQERFSDALSAFNIATELVPKSFCAWHNKGIIYVQMNEDDLAINAFRNALDICPDSAWSAINMAALLRDQDQVPQAIDVLLGVYKHNQADVTVLQNLGAYYSYNGDLNKAIEYTLLAVELDDRRPLLYWNLADSHAKLSNRDQCLNYLTIAIEKDSELADRFMSDKDFEDYWWDADFQRLVESARTKQG